MKNLLLLLWMLCSINSYSQHQVRNKVAFPQVGNYHVLKADFHIHTSFSDGSVWPSERVSEAYNEDLDVFAITDHLEIQRYLKDVTTADNLNRSYEIASEAAQQYSIQCIKGTEITREVPPGHTNAIFIEDAATLFNPTNNEKPSSAAGYEVAVERANEQGAFVFYNHPFHNLPDDKVVMPEAVNNLIDRGLIQGIEVVNGDRFSKEAFNWALQHDLTFIANSDVHTSMPLAMKQHDIKHRAMTLILSKDTTIACLKDALKNRRTLIWWRDYVIGRQEIIEPFVRAVLLVTRYTYKEGKLLFYIENQSSQKFTLEPISTDDYFIAHPIVATPDSESRIALNVKRKDNFPVSISFRVANAWVNYEQPLIITYVFK